jgi:threonine dehydrogenase-like Zn-dependent dehydrogenase
MKQLLQNLRDGKTIVAEAPVPTPRPGTALVRTAASLVSAGTERTLVEFAEKSLVGKAQSRPDLVRQVLDKARREGLLTTIEAAFNKLDQPMPLGYSSAGTIAAVGPGLEGFQVGDRVACAGGGYAVHAEYAIVPGNLLAKLPPQVDFEAAAFTTLGAIALHGFRLAQPQLGERVAIIGLGLLGLLTVGIARAAGCQVFGVDLDPQRVALAESQGAKAVIRSEAETAGAAFSHGRGFDAVLVCADARSNDPIELAGALARDRGRVVAVGAFGLDIPRKAYFEKEIHFQVSRSYGPGRYDPAYEEGGQDYPIGYVRWTEGRNLEAIVDLLASGALDVAPLISHRFAIEDAPQAYDLITGKTREPFLGVLLTYPQSPEGDVPAATRIELTDSGKARQAVEGEVRVGVLGAGNYAMAMFLPAMQKVGGATLATIASAQGLSAAHAGRKFGFQAVASDEREVLEDADIQAVVLLTRHQQHARQTCAALAQGKHVYCEKPLAITPDQLAEVATAMDACGNAGDRGLQPALCPAGDPAARISDRAQRTAGGALPGECGIYSTHALAARSRAGRRAHHR